MESQTVEYKKSFGKEVIISLVAFANTGGGKVIVGVDDNGRSCGLAVGPETVQRYFFKVELQQVEPVTPPITPPIFGVDLIPVADLERRILVLLNDRPTLTGSKLAEDFGIGRGTVKEYLRRLKAKRVLVREGSTRTGRWPLTETGKAAIDRDE